MQVYLSFEKSISELEGKIHALRHMGGDGDLDVVNEIRRLQKRNETLLSTTYAKLNAWQKVQVARHVLRPHTLAYIRALIEDFQPLAGDRCFGEDASIIGGLGRFRGRSVVIMGHEKGHDAETRVHHNFGMAKPEGYRKAIRLMELAERFSLPIITLVDTSGAWPGVDAEARGQAEAIARNIETCLRIRVPLLSVIIGEGGSGGAIALAAANRVLMLEHSVYSVISPEGCASILWRDGDMAENAAEALRLTAQDLYALGVIDEIITEPLGGAHRDASKAIDSVGDALERQLKALVQMDAAAIYQQRQQKFLQMGKKIGQQADNNADNNTGQSQQPQREP